MHNQYNFPNFLGVTTLNLPGWGRGTVPLSLRKNNTKKGTEKGAEKEGRATEGRNKSKGKGGRVRVSYRM